MSEELTTWVKNSAPRAVAYATSLVRNRAIAEELVQDCYLRLLQKAEQYNLVSDGDRLLFKSITHASINWTQRKPPEVSLDAAFPQRELGESNRTDAPDELAARDELSDAIDAALGELPLEQRAVVELSSLGHSSAEIGEAVGVTAGHARVLLHRAREALAARLKPFLKDDES